MCCFAAFPQFLFVSLIYERFFQHPIQQFVDLCSLANISVFILETDLYGYYIHGRSVHGRADTGLREMHLNFVREEVSVFYSHNRNKSETLKGSFLEYLRSSLYTNSVPSGHVLNNNDCQSQSFSVRAFAAAGPDLWNSLSSYLKEADLSYNIFQQSLETCLFGCCGHGTVWTFFNCAV